MIPPVFDSRRNLGHEKNAEMHFLGKFRATPTNCYGFSIGVDRVGHVDDRRERPLVQGLGNGPGVSVAVQASARPERPKAVFVFRPEGALTN
ncbi:MAG: hypothetical protein WD065_06640 [Planctomycetaceae bacterium]